MAASIADQTQAVLDYQQWREERNGQYVDVSAAAYVDHLETQDKIARFDALSEMLNKPTDGSAMSAIAILDKVRDLVEA